MLFLALLAAAPPQIRIVAEPPASIAAASEGVTVFALNEGDAATDTVPVPIDVVAADGTSLRIMPENDAAVSVPAGGFRRLRYRTVTAPPPPARETVVATADGTVSGFLDRFEPHEPIYGVFGFGSDGAKLQFSLAVRPFDGAGVLDGVRVAWTQTMFWAIDQSSGPFRSTNYSPEVYYQRSIAPRLVAAGGYAHDSNGRGDVGSIDVNRLYLAASYALPLGDDWQVEVAPKLWSYVGTGYRDLDRYWGNWSLGAAIGQRDGLKLAARLRNPLGVRRAGEAQLSYPLARIGGGTALYLFGQAFSGYGEAIDDYRLRTTTARIGVSFTR
ncbi:phospholipase A [Sphingomonas sp. Leaf4]|uniref:phospholipase A n=1 Tax=Sphingomonas sp. Leaf4 TaxID=2876553 RepID=UPI001E5523F1|nr:phospholipase A [Sphingomonas sp. Leaf4]